jgi:hypothetical protein
MRDAAMRGEVGQGIDEACDEVAVGKRGGDEADPHACTSRQLIGSRPFRFGRARQ